jgi:hypothetical protein
MKGTGGILVLRLLFPLRLTLLDNLGLLLPKN